MSMLPARGLSCGHNHLRRTRYAAIFTSSGRNGDSLCGASCTTTEGGAGCWGDACSWPNYDHAVTPFARRASLAPARVCTATGAAMPP